jgi:predicted permease
MRQDLRLALRQLRRTPAFASATILTLALGIGANTAVFSVMNAVVVRLLPVAHAERLVFLHTTGQPSNSSQTGHDDTSLALPIYEQLRLEHGIFSDLMAFVPLDTNRTAIRYGNEPETAFADMVSGNFFSGLGVRMARGRAFTPDDEVGHSQTAVLSDGFWARRFGRNPSILGDTLFIKGVPFTVIGVTAPEFTGVEHTNATDLWIPIQARPELKPWGRPAQSPQGLYDSPDWWFLMTIGRLAPGVSEAQAIAMAQPGFERAAYSAIGPPGPTERVPHVYFSPARGIQGLRKDYQQPLTILMAMVGVVLLIACGNVSMLLAARNSAREREFSLRAALGGSRARLFRQLVVESLLLVGSGTLLGWLFAVAATRALAASSGLDVTLSPDGIVLAFTLVLSVLAALVFSLAPLAGAARVPMGTVLRTSSANTTADRGKTRAGQAIVALLIALCLVLLVGAGLMVRTLGNLTSVDLGLRTSGLLVFGITPPQTVRGDEAVARFYQLLVSRLRAVPGVESATVMGNRIGSGWSNNAGAIVDGQKPDPQRFSPMRWNAVGPDYFHVLGTPLRLGRDFTDADGPAAPPVVIVNDTFVQRYLANRQPLGHHVTLGKEYTIVGVAANSRYTGVRETDRPVAYFPYTQVPSISGMHVELRASGVPTALLPQARRIVAELGTDVPLVQPMTQVEQFNESFADERLFARLAALFGLLAAALVATGLYGTLEYRVSRRTSEIGVRMALGARRHQVLWMVVRETLAVSGIGIGVGLPLAIGGARVLKTILFGIGPGDPASFALAFGGIALVAVAASLIPARRATSVNPMIALRYD